MEEYKKIYIFFDTRMILLSRGFILLKIIKGVMHSTYVTKEKIYIGFSLIIKKSIFA